MEDARTEITVLGIGNPLVADEGVGVRVVEELMTSYHFPESVSVMDAGTMGMSMLGTIMDTEHLIVVDAVDGTDKPPGTVVLMAPEDLKSHQIMHSLHDIRLVDVLASARLAGRCPASVVVGIQVELLESMKIGLTEPVAAGVPQAVHVVLDLLTQHGVFPEPRESSDPDAQVLRALRTFEKMPGPPEDG